MLVDVAQQALMITAFVFLMMVVVEYLNVLTAGTWVRGLERRGYSQYVLAVVLGAVPGCLGAFTMVTLYEHGVVSAGALIATMIATSGDEAFVMLAMIPGSFAVLTAVMIVVGVVVGALADWCLRRWRGPERLPPHAYEVHDEEPCQCYPRGQILQQWRECTLARATLAGTLTLLAAAIVAGTVGSQEWNWVRVTLLLTSALALFIVATVPEHFLEQHLWQHAFKQHVPGIFLWTFGALLLVTIGHEYLAFEQWVRGSPAIVLLVAALIGIIPESGPHLLFVTLYAQRAIPFSVLLASCIVQDGHGMLPLLAHSRKDFIGVKAANLAVGIAIGLAVYAAGS